MKSLGESLENNSYLKEYADGCPSSLNKIDYSAEVWWQCVCITCKAEWSQKPSGTKPDGHCPRCGGWFAYT